jgi:hypothetical protein
VRAKGEIAEEPRLQALFEPDHPVSRTSTGLNVLLAAERRGRLATAARHQLVRFLADLPVTIDGDTAAQAWRTTAILAERHGLTPYDAVLAPPDPPRRPQPPAASS